MVKIFSVSIDEEVFEKFEKERKENYPLLKRSTILEQLILKFLGEKVYFK